jgi:hypothetical protein
LAQKSSLALYSLTAADYELVLFNCYQVVRSYRNTEDKLILRANFEVFTAVMSQFEVCWVVTPCSVVVNIDVSEVDANSAFQGGGSMDL